MNLYLAHGTKFAALVAYAVVGFASGAMHAI